MKAAIEFERTIIDKFNKRFFDKSCKQLMFRAIKFMHSSLVANLVSHHAFVEIKMLKFIPD